MEWDSKVDGVSVKGGRIHWEVASTCRSQKERAGGECQGHSTLLLVRVMPANSLASLEV